MANESNNNDSTKEFKAIKKALEEQEKTRIFEPVSETGQTVTQPVNTQEIKHTNPDPANKLRRRKASADAEKAMRPLPPWLKVTLKVLRKLLIPILCVVALIIGLHIGYAGFGNEDPGDVWDFGTWKHLFDLIFADGTD